MYTSKNNVIPSAICMVIFSHRVQWGVMATHCLIANISPRVCSHSFISMCINQSHPVSLQRAFSFDISLYLTRCCSECKPDAEILSYMSYWRHEHKYSCLLVASHHMQPVRSGKATCSAERGSDPAG